MGAPADHTRMGARRVGLCALLLATACGGSETTSADPATLSLELVPTSATVEQGGSVTVTGAATVGGSFTGDATVTLEGWPSGLTGVVSDVRVRAATTTVTVTLSVGPAVPPGTYDLTVRASGSGVSALATFTLTVVAAPGVRVSIDYSMCPDGNRPTWLALQDGTGPWTRIAPVGGVYELSVSAETAALALLFDTGGLSTTAVTHLTRAQWMGVESIEACPSLSTKTVSGVLAGSVGVTEISLGQFSTVATTDGPFQLARVGEGPLDLVVYSSAATGADRMLIRRDLDVPDGGDLGTVDLADGFAAASATITLTGVGGDESLAGASSYATVSPGQVCSLAPLQAVPAQTNPFTAVGAPSSEQDTDDFHVLSVTAFTSGGSRSVTESFHSLDDRTIAMGAPLPAPTVGDATATANYLRLSAEVSVPPEYDGNFTFSYNDGSRFVQVAKSHGLQGSAVVLAFPDFTDVTGWVDAWAPDADATGVAWFLTVSSAQFSAETSCTEGGRSAFAGVSGTFN